MFKDALVKGDNLKSQSGKVPRIKNVVVDDISLSMALLNDISTSMVNVNSSMVSPLPPLDLFESDFCSL